MADRKDHTPPYNHSCSNAPSVELELDKIDKLEVNVEMSTNWTLDEGRGRSGVQCGDAPKLRGDPEFVTHA